MNLILEAPLNSLSFGNVSFNIIRELHKLDVNLGIFPTGDPDLSAFDVSDDLSKYIEDALNNRWKLISKLTPTFKLWHLNGSENRKTKDQHLFSFYECSEPTELETKIVDGLREFGTSTESRHKPNKPHKDLNIHLNIVLF